MASTWLYPVIILAGILQALGVAMNAQLRNSLTNPWLASVISFAPILVFFLIAWAAMPKPLPTMAMFSSMPWWAPLGGLAGALAVYVGLTAVDKVGAGPLSAMIITANIITCLAMDHFGWLGMPVHAINPYRLGGAILLIAGVGLISRF